MLESIASSDMAACVDFFEDPAGGFGFEHFRADVEDGGRWTAVGGFGSRRYESTPAATSAAVEAIGWLRLDPSARTALQEWQTRSASRVIIRDAQRADAEAIAKIWHLGWRDGHLGHVAQEVVALRTSESFQRRAADRISGTRVAIVDEQIAGFVMVVDDEFEQVYVSADHRGAGIANTLMADAERQVKANGHKTAWLAVVAGNARARRFYERQGWSDAGEVEYLAGTADGGSVPVPSQRYEKLLD